jgi:fatty-acid desaturase
VTTIELERPPQADPYGRLPRQPDEHVNRRSSIAFFVVHLMPLLVFVTGITWTAVALFFITYFGRGFFITAGYHRYFAHRSYKLRRSAHRDCARLGRGVQRGGAPSRGSA